MAKGQILKQEIGQHIIESFSDAFFYNNGKEIRINGTEEGEPIQIKVVLTASKTIVQQGDENQLPQQQVLDNKDFHSDFSSTPIKDTIVEPSKEEKENVKTFLKSLGL